MNFSQTITPVVDQFVIQPNGSHTTTFGGIASFVQIANISGNAVTVKINALDTAAFTLPANTVQEFTARELQITSLVFTNTGSGVVSADIEVLYGVIS